LILNSGERFSEKVSVLFEKKEGAGDSVELVKFKELEGKVRVLIEEYSLLKKRNQELEVLLKKKDGDLEEVNSALKKLYEERDTVRSKVDSLLDMMQDIRVPG